MQKHLLIIDDDEKLCDLLTSYLSRYDYSVSAQTQPLKALEILATNTFDAVILDVMLPEMDGFETLKAIRKQSNVPVIMLTARGDTMDRIVGLELGADDYLPKPFEPRELLARLQTVLRRYQTVYQANSNQVLTSGLLTLDIFKRAATLNSAPLDLTTMEFEILLLLMRNPSRVISRDDIMEEIKGIDWDAFNRSIDVAISRLRTKLGDDAKHPQYIKTIWGRGYQFIGVVSHAN